MTDTYILDTLHRWHMINDRYIYIGHITQVAHEQWHMHISWTHYKGDTWAMTDTYILDTLHKGHIKNYRYIYIGHITQVIDTYILGTLHRWHMSNDRYIYLGHITQVAHKQWQIHISWTHFTGDTSTITDK